MGKLTIRPLFDAPTSTFTYLLYLETGQALLIDSVKEQFERDLKLVSELGLSLKYLIETHVHADHITGAGLLSEKTAAKIVYGAKSGVQSADLLINDGESIDLEGTSIIGLSTPGHTAGCTSWLIEGQVFTGDSLMIRGCGRTDFQQGSSEVLYQSVHQQLFSLSDQTRIYPGHNYQGHPWSTVGEEKMYNPRLGGQKSLEEFKRIMDNLKLAPPQRLAQSVPANLKCGKD